MSPTNDTPTPRTDAEVVHCLNDDYLNAPMDEHVPADFARCLERELAAAKYSLREAAAALEIVLARPGQAGCEARENAMRELLNQERTEHEATIAQRDEALAKLDGRQAALAWITGRDTGQSSITIWAVMMGAVDPTADSWTYSTPMDADDLGRCLRLLDRVPEWKPRLPEVAERFPAWGPLVREWSRLEAAYYEDERDTGNRVGRIFSGLRDEVFHAAGFKKTGPGSWIKAEAKA